MGIVSSVICSRTPSRLCPIISHAALLLRLCGVFLSVGLCNSPKLSALGWEWGMRMYRINVNGSITDRLKVKRWMTEYSEQGLSIHWNYEKLDKIYKMQGCNCFQALDNDLTVGKETSEAGSTISWLSDWRYLPDCCIRRANESRARQNHELSRVLRRWGGWGRLNLWTKGVIPKWSSQNLHRNPFESLAGDRASHAQD